MIAGLILGGLGLFGVYMLVTAGIAFVRWEAGFIVFGVVGGWLFLEALRVGHYLLVAGPQGYRKIIFNGTVEESQLREFLSHATRLGYDCRFGSQ